MGASLYFGGIVIHIARFFAIHHNFGVIKTITYKIGKRSFKD
jgi:hypothetical protein